MASFRSVATACVAVMTSGLASAAGLAPDTGEIAVSLNEPVSLELVTQSDGTLKAVLLKPGSSKRPHIRLRLSGDEGMRMLEVENHYERTLNYTARTCMKKRNLCAKTSVVPVPAGLTAFESWGDPIDLLVLSQFSFVSDMDDIVAAAEYADFIRAIAIPTAVAETRTGEWVKFLMIGKREDGEIVVRNIGLLSIEDHAPATKLDGALDVAVIAHVHHERMRQAPGKEDALTVRHHGIPNFVVSSDGRRIWEVGVISGTDMYREIGEHGTGEWLNLR